MAKIEDKKGKNTVVPKEVDINTLGGRPISEVVAERALQLCGTEISSAGVEAFTSILTEMETKKREEDKEKLVSLVKEVMKCQTEIKKIENEYNSTMGKAKKALSEVLKKIDKIANGASDSASEPAPQEDK